jgi:hypothetical protein
MGISKIDHIETLVSTLTREEQLLLIERLAHRLRQAQAGRVRRWRDFRGLGKEIWQGVDTQAYIDTLRDEWEP